MWTIKVVGTLKSYLLLKKSSNFLHSEPAGTLALVPSKPSGGISTTFFVLFAPDIDLLVVYLVAFSLWSRPDRSPSV